MSLIVETVRVACTERSAHGVEMERQTTLPASRSDQDASRASISSKKTATTVANVRPGVNRESQNGNPTHNYFSKGRHHCDRLCEMVPAVYHSLFGSQSCDGEKVCQHFFAGGGHRWQWHDWQNSGLSTGSRTCCNHLVCKNHRCL